MGDGTSLHLPADNNLADATYASFDAAYAFHHIAQPQIEKFTGIQHWQIRGVRGLRC